MEKYETVRNTEVTLCYLDTAKWFLIKYLSSNGELTHQSITLAK